MNRPTIKDRLELIESDEDADLVDFAVAVRSGLTASQKHLPCRFFYDAEGSRIFEEICELPEYYLTRGEREILEKHGTDVAGLFPQPIVLGELGSGSSLKTELLIEAFLTAHGRLRYVPVDISRTMLEESALGLLEQYDGLEVLALACEYEEGIRLLAEETDQPKLILWLGSNIGNLDREEAEGFLSALREILVDGDALLVGIDLRKEREILERAYDDAAGVTARFNRNLLARINRELGGGFDLESFRHRAIYDDGDGRVEIHLVSTRSQTVRIADLDLEVSFEAGETIHTENSYKYSVEEIEGLVRGAGLRPARQWFDHERHFSLNLLRGEAGKDRNGAAP